MPNKQDMESNFITEAERRRFMSNLEWAQQVVSNWSEEKRAYTATGFPVPTQSMIRAAKAKSIDLKKS